jgi:hypothetical protein
MELVRQCLGQSPSARVKAWGAGSIEFFDPLIPGGRAESAPSISRPQPCASCARMRNSSLGISLVLN